MREGGREGEGGMEGGRGRYGGREGKRGMEEREGGSESGYECTYTNVQILSSNLSTKTCAVVLCSPIKVCYYILCVCAKRVMGLVCPFVICLKIIIPKPQIPLGQLQAKKFLSNLSFGVCCVVLPWESLCLINTCTFTNMSA